MLLPGTESDAGTAELFDFPVACIRVGATPTSLPFRYSVFYENRPGRARIVGFDHPGFSWDEFRRVVRQIIRLCGGKPVEYFRAGSPFVRVWKLEKKGSRERLVMSKEKHSLRHADEAKLPDGSYDLEQIKAEVAKGFENIENGHAKIAHFSQQPHGKGLRFVVDIEPTGV